MAWSIHSGSLPPHLSDPSHSLVSEVMEFKFQAVDDRPPPFPQAFQLSSKGRKGRKKERNGERGMYVWWGKVKRKGGVGGTWVVGKKKKRKEKRKKKWKGGVMGGGEKRKEKNNNNN